MTDISPSASKYSDSTSKRVLDIFLATLALLFILLPSLVIAALVKLTSNETVIFKQKRMGCNNKPFTIYKFRTMRSGAHNLQKKYRQLNISPFPTFKIPDDPRLTSLGSFLSKTTLDELPQLINVLIGDMSIVGPRPFPANEHKLLSKKWQLRTLVKPGLISPIFFHPRTRVSAVQWEKTDLNYIRNSSLTMDLQLIFKTISQYIKILIYQIQKTQWK